MDSVPAIRIRAVNDRAIRPTGEYVLYWMIAARRPCWNFALDRALELCHEMGKPLLVLEALRADYPWASDRLHSFVIQGMRDNAAAFRKADVTYYPYVEPQMKRGRGLLAALAARASAVVTDEYPCFFLPKMIEKAGRRLDVRLEAVDSNGLLPLRATPRPFDTAYSFRRFLQKELGNHLLRMPRSTPFRGFDLPLAKISREIRVRWPATDPRALENALERLPIDHSVRPVSAQGGHVAARAAGHHFVRKMLDGYTERRNCPDEDGTSGLSPYLHFGHISAHEVFQRIAAHEKWRPEKLSLRANGRREGWWRMSKAAEAFLDELVTWRELGFVFAYHRPDYDRYESLPAWARKTLEAHTRDERTFCYSVDQFSAARTHDPLWNAAQTQLLREGRIHNYLRMLWGKKILEWSRTPRQALASMIELNNRFAIDGRDPNSYSGIFWCLGRFDRPWGPERPIFGTVRYMSSENTARKLRVKEYLRRYGC